jgi:hypothetical protein
MTLSNRDFAIRLGTKLINSRTEEGQIKPILRVAFRVEKSLAKDPNTAEVSIYNLTEETRGLLSQKGLPTIIRAGYADGDAHIIFQGKLDYGSTTRNGPDWISDFESTDGGKELRQSRISVSFKSITFGQAIKEAASAMGLGLGNIEKKIRGGNLRGALEEFANGMVLDGQASTQLDKLASSYGFEWSVQDEQIIFLEPNGLLDPEQAIELTPETGLIGSPQAGDEGRVTARSLMIPSLQPGKKVRIESSLVTGFFRVERSVFLGDTWGNDWYTDIEAKPL